jgi:putative RecB family exonuclease
MTVSDVLETRARAGLEPGDPPGGSPARRGRSALSPSRINDFKRCPLLFRLRVIDRLPEPPSAAAARGTLVHAVLERLFDLPTAHRTPAAAHALLGPEWERLVAGEPDLAGLFADDGALAAWLDGARALLSAYFTVEDPRRLEPAERELLCEVELPSGVLVRGIVDRLDVARDGALRVVDYKTGRSPAEPYAATAVFQPRFYALVLWRLRGVLPRRLQLVYLGDARVITYDPDEQSLLATERVVEAVWAAIRRATAAQDFPARPSRLCGWCAHRALCPAFGGTLPSWPAGGAERLLGVAGVAADGTTGRAPPATGLRG